MAFASIPQRNLLPASVEKPPRLLFTVGLDPVAMPFEEGKGGDTPAIQEVKRRLSGFETEEGRKKVHMLCMPVPPICPGPVVINACPPSSFQELTPLTATDAVGACRVSPFGHGQMTSSFRPHQKRGQLGCSKYVISCGVEGTWILMRFLKLFRGLSSLTIRGKT